MKSIYMVLSASLFLCTSSNAQSLVNGSFESTNPGPGSCYYLNNIGFATYTNGADTGYGTANNISFLSTPVASCVYGQPKDGLAYIALTANNTKYDAIAMKVSPAMQPGKHYTISFYYKCAMSGPEITMILGYSANNKTDGTLIANVPKAVNSDTIWKSMSYDFSPTIAANYITLKANLNGLLGYSFAELDNFVLQSAAGVNDVAENNLFTLAPNPAAGYTVITTPDNKPLHITISDMTGRSIKTGDYTPNNKNVNLELDNLTAGFYLLQINNGSASSIQKLEIVQ